MENKKLVILNYIKIFADLSVNTYHCPLDVCISSKCWKFPGTLDDFLAICKIFLATFGQFVKIVYCLSRAKSMAFPMIGKFQQTKKD